MSSKKPLVRLTRRQILASLGTIGVATVGAGLGTTAYYSDREDYLGNELVAGEFDLKVDWQQTYTGPDGFTYVNAYPDNFLNDPNDPSQLQMQSTPLGPMPIQGSDNIQDPIRTRDEVAQSFHGTTYDNLTDEQRTEVESAYRSQFTDVPDYLERFERPLIRIDDVKPGDEGEVTFSLHLFDNPGYVWMNGRVVAAAENGHTEPESTDDDEVGAADSTDPADVELLDEIQVDLWYDDDCDNVYDEEVEELFYTGSLRDALAALSSGHGVPLDGDRSTPYEELNGDGDAPNAGNAEGRDCYTPTATHCIGFRWYLPVDHANEIQTDSVTFDLGFYAEQCRHNDGAGQDGVVDVPEIPTETGDGFAKQTHNFNGDGTSSGGARARYGNNGPTGAWELAVGNEPGVSGQFNQADYVWTSGSTVDWTVAYDEATDELSFTFDGTPVTSYTLTSQPDGRIAVQGKADEATVEISDLSLSVGGSPVALTGPTGVTAMNDGSGREVRHLLIGTALDGATSFTLSGKATVTLQGDYGGSDEGVAFDVVLE